MDKIFQFFPNFQATFPIFISVETSFGILQTFEKTKVPNRYNYSRLYSYQRTAFYFYYTKDCNIIYKKTFEKYFRQIIVMY